MATISLAEVRAFTFRTLREVAELARARARNYLIVNRGSRTLARDMQVQVFPSGKARVFVPHFWAVYHHDGRGAIQMPRGKFLVFFPETKDDPRIGGGTNYPVSEADVKHLSRSQFFSGLERNRKRLFSGSTQPFMIATRFVGPTQGVPFFEEGLRDFDNIAGPLISRRFSEFLISRLGGLRKKSGVTGSIG